MGKLFVGSLGTLWRNSRSSVFTLAYFLTLIIRMSLIILCAIWYHLYKLKNVKKNFLFLKFYKWYQIAQSV